MPDPRDHIDDDYTYVRGHVRKKRSNGGNRGKKPLDWTVQWLIVVVVGLGIFAIFSEPMRMVLLAGLVALVGFLILAALLFGVGKLLARVVNRLLDR